jgi:hydrogenase expression/formation protein HypD
VKTLVQAIKQRATRIGRPVKLMEVCGTHTMVAFRTGLRQLLPESVQLLSGPGCPVCVTDTNYIDAAIALARRPGVILATFGDLMRVPGSESSLEQERAAGADVRVVYSPTDAVALAREQHGASVVFLGVGFETTAPTVAASIMQAVREDIRTYTVLCAHKTMPRAMEALLAAGDVKVDGFICPGHVTVITGAKMYRPVCERFAVPCVIAGFEAWDMMKAITMLLEQVSEKRAAVEIEYTRSVNENGNVAAQRLMREVFEETDASWRGLGVIPGSGLKIREQYARHDAVAALGVSFGEAKTHPGCRCGEVLRGAITPAACRLFGKACTPSSPVGPCMVSTEGTCAAHYKYARRVAA